MLSTNKINFIEIGTKAKIKRNKIKQWIINITSDYNIIPKEVNYIFCNDDYILEINKEYLGHNYYTDIITFDLSDGGSTEKIVDIFISVDRIKDNSVLQNSSLEEEMLRVIIHGILHVCGFNDKTKKEKEIMRKVENAAIERYYAMFHVK
jgi:rRNA maturation RNase YbeY